jgi:CheY-like chemotaxis protein
MPEPRLPRFLVCEDGHEYSERFARLLGNSFRFERAADFAEALAKLAAFPDTAALLLDLDFRRAPAERLIDESGAGSVGAAWPEETRRRLAEVQGILILRALRAAGVTLSALLFADIDDDNQVRFLERIHAPLLVVSSETALTEIAGLLARLAGKS